MATVTYTGGVTAQGPVKKQQPGGPHAHGNTARQVVDDQNDHQNDQADAPIAGQSWGQTPRCKRGRGPGGAGGATVKTQIQTASS